MSRRNRWVRPCLESLDARLAPAVFTWDGGGANDLFSTAKNWAGDVAPQGKTDDELVFPAVADASNRFAINDLAAANGTTQFQSITIRDNYTIDDVNALDNSFLTTRVTQFVSIEAPVVMIDTILAMPDTTATFALNDNTAVVAEMVGNARIAIGSGDLRIGSDDTLNATSQIGGVVTGSGRLTLDSAGTIAFTGVLQLGGPAAELVVGRAAGGQAGSPTVDFFGGTVAPAAGTAVPSFDVLSGFLAFTNTTYPPDLVTGADGGKWDFGPPPPGDTATVAAVASKGITISGNADVIIDGKAKTKSGTPDTKVSGSGRLFVRGAAEQTVGGVSLGTTDVPITIEAGTLVLRGGVVNTFGGGTNVQLTAGTLGGTGSEFGGIDDLRIVATGGVIDPGSTGAPGRLRVATIDAGKAATVSLQIAGSGAGAFDQILVTESVTMLGKLEVAVPDGATLNTSGPITVVDTVTQSGVFTGPFLNRGQDTKFADTNMNYGFLIHYIAQAQNTNVTLLPFDLALPTVALAGGQGTTVGSEPLDYVVTFSLPVTGFDPADVQVTAPGLGTPTVSITPLNPNFNGFATQFKMQLTGLSGTGTVTIAVPAGGVQDQDQLPNKLSIESTSITVDTVSPGVTISSPTTSPTNATSVVVTFLFSESVAQFDLGDLTVSNATLSNFQAVSGFKYTVAVAPTANGPVTITVPANSAKDAVGNPSTAASFTFAFDSNRPTVAIASSLSSPTGATAIPITITFDEPVSNFVLSDVTVANGTAGGFTAVSATQYTLTVAPGSAGTVAVSVPSGAALDAAGNGNLPNSFGIQFNPTSPPPPPPDPTLVGFPQFVAGSDGGGAVTFYNPDRSVRFSVTPFPGFAGGVRTAAADFNRDGVADVVAGTGPGAVTRVRVLDGVSQAELFSVQPFESGFTGGVYVSAGDVNGDGVPDLAITPDEGGGPRVDVYNGANFNIKIVSFFGIDDPNFRGGARSGIADLTGDGVGDLIVVAGFGGGPRVAGFDGSTLGGERRKIFNDFFAFEQTLRNGIFVAAGDVNGDGFADLICGGGPGGGPRVLIFDGKALTTANQQTPIANFFGGDDSSRGGIRLGVKNLDGDNRADLVVGAGTGTGSRLTAYLGRSIAADGTPPEAFAFEAFAGFTGGVFVG